MTEHVMIDLEGDRKGARGTQNGKVVGSGMRRVDVAKRFRRIILLVLCLYALSSFQMTYLVDKVFSTFFK